MKDFEKTLADNKKQSIIGVDDRLKAEERIDKIANSARSQKKDLEEKVDLANNNTTIYKTRLELFIRTILPETGEITLENISDLTNEALGVISKWKDSGRK